MGFEEEVHHAQEIDAARRRRAGEPDLIPPLPEWHLILVSELVKHGIRKVPIFVVVKSRIKKTLRFESHTTDWFTRVDEAWAIDLRQPEEGGTFSYLFLISPGSLTRGSWISAQTSDVTSGGARYRRVTHGLPGRGAFGAGARVLPDDPEAMSMAIAAVASLRSRGAQWTPSESGSYTVDGPGK
ncbi:hypothetical protein GCM10022204_26760 [Microlunatus aurantiacus]|uniref:Uncharacterized protein n=1 Tax=Microlunatus aurantiacus TaxID=446786 RepID=A0ABP7DNX4_9ACTN